MLVIQNAALRRIARIVVPFLAIPAVVWLGARVFAAKRYAFVSLAVAFLALLLFTAGYEQKKTGARRMVLVSVLTALSVAGRLIPLFKPVTAFTMLTGMYLGGEAGFLVGALSAVLSNAYFGQGSWTPFQMLAWGLIGLFAGLFAKPLQKSRVLLLFCGLLAGVAFSCVMDVWTVLWYNGSFSLSLYLTALATAMPHTVLYAASNVLFLWALARPFGEKFTRIKRKYGV